MDIYGNLNSFRFADFLLPAISTGLEDVKKLKRNC